MVKCLLLGLVRCVFRYGVCNLVLRFGTLFVNELCTVIVFCVL